MILTGQAARDYINSGNRDWKPVSGIGENTNYLSTASKLAGEGSPFQSQAGVTMLDQPGLLANIAQGIGGIINRPNQITMAQQPYATNFATNADELQKIQQLRQNAPGEYLKSGLGLASLAIPGTLGGTGLLGILAAGALGGGLYGASQNTKGEDLIGDILKNALLGAGTAGVLGVAGKGLSKVSSKLGIPEKLGNIKTGLSELSPIEARTVSPEGTLKGLLQGQSEQANVLKSLITPAQEKQIATKTWQPRTQADLALIQKQPELANISAARKSALDMLSPSYEGLVKSPNPFTREAAVKTTLNDFLDFNKIKDTGVKGPLGMVTPGNFEKGIQLMADKLMPKAQAIASKVKTPLITKTELTGLLDDFAKTAPTNVANAVDSYIKPMLGKYKEALPATDLLDFGMRTSEFSTGIGKKMMSDSLLSGAQDASVFVSQTLKKLYETNPITAELNPIFDKMTTYNMVKPGVFKFSTNSPTMWTLNMPISQKYFSVPARNVLAAGSSIKPNMGNILKALGTNVPSGPLNLGMIGNLGGQNTVSSQNLLQAPTTTPTAPGMTQPNVNLINQYLPQTTSKTTNQASVGSNQSQQTILNLLASGMKPSDVKLVAELLGISGAASKPTKLTKDQVNATSGIQSINDIRALLPKTGNLTLAIPYFLKSAEGKQLDDAINNATDVIARLRTGAAISANEEKLFRSYLPTLTDDSATVEYKLGRLEQMFNNLLNTDTKSSQLTDILNAQ